MPAKLNDLLTKYPDFFSNQNQWNFRCEDGWYYLLDGLLGYIDLVLMRLEYRSQTAQSPQFRKFAPQFRIGMIKEKYGQLEFSWNCTDVPTSITNEITGAVALAEKLSQTVCELCGNVGTMSTMDTSFAKDWKRVLCSGCEAKKCQKFEDAAPKQNLPNSNF